MTWLLELEIAQARVAVGTREPQPLLPLGLIRHYKAVGCTYHRIDRLSVKVLEAVLDLRFHRCLPPFRNVSWA